MTLTVLRKIMCCMTASLDVVQQPCALLLQALGETYRWMLYGDDDTLFFVDAVLDLLQPFDPELPYAISDNIWFEANSALVSGPCVLVALHAVRQGMLLFMLSFSMRLLSYVTWKCFIFISREAKGTYSTAAHIVGVCTDHACMPPSSFN